MLKPISDPDPEEIVGNGAGDTAPGCTPHQANQPGAPHLQTRFDMSANSEKLKDYGAVKDPPATPADPRGVRIDGYFGPGLLRPGVGQLVQRTGEPQFCGSMAFRVYAVTDGPVVIKGVVQPGDKRSYRFSGEFMGVTFEGKQLWAADGYLPSSIVRTAVAAVNRGEGFGFAGDLWCEPAEASISFGRGYTFTVYDRRPRGAADPLMALAVAAGIVDAPAVALPAPAAMPEEIDPETGEVRERQGEAA
jgi:hypothetical protein